MSWIESVRWFSRLQAMAVGLAVRLLLSLQKAASRPRSFAPALGDLDRLGSVGPDNGETASRGLYASQWTMQLERRAEIIPRIDLCRPDKFRRPIRCLPPGKEHGNDLGSRRALGFCPKECRFRTVSGMSALSRKKGLWVFSRCSIATP